MDDINPEFPRTDVALVIGANDVTNPAAKTNPGSPIYGMPILDVESSHSVVVIKRSMNPGFAGIENELYYKPQTAMLFGDAKTAVQTSPPSSRTCSGVLAARSCFARSRLRAWRARLDRREPRRRPCDPWRSCGRPRAVSRFGRASGVSRRRAELAERFARMGVIARGQALAALAEEPFDVAVVGGGITGAGVALDAASRGYSVALLERADYASGTSSRSSKLVHGGLRYLQQFDLGLVREALLERQLMVALAPHLVRPLPIVVAGVRAARGSTASSASA